MFRSLSYVLPRSLALLLISCCSCLLPLCPAQDLRSVDLRQWKPLKTGGGGWMTGLHVHPSGQPVFARSDVGSAYRWDESTLAWTNVVTAWSMPEPDVHWSKHSGVLSIVSAPSDKRVAYMAYQDGIFRSDDAGDHWIRTGLPALAMKPNADSSKLAGERLSVDPSNPHIVYFGSINDGLFHTQDGGDSWSQIESVPAGLKERGVRQILFDAATRSNDGTQRILVIVDGEGVYESKDAGLSWLVVKDSIEEPLFFDAEISAGGVLYVCGVDSKGRSTHLRRYEDGKWKQVFAATGHAIGEIALDPFNPNRAVLMTEGFSDTYLSENLLSDNPTWDKRSYNRKSESIPWLATTEGGWFSLGEVIFDPQVQDRLWIAEGTGIWRTSDLQDDNVTWQSATVGQEHLVSSDIVSLPNGRSITAHWDRPLFLHAYADEFPKEHQPSNRFNSGWALDRNPSDPEFVVAIVEDHRYCCYEDGQHRTSGYSTDAGQTWIPFSSFPTFRDKDSVHGRIAVSANSRDNLVWLPAWNSMPYFTHDRGQTWAKAELPGNSGNCCLAAPWFQRECLVADRVLDATFYIYDWAEGHLFRSSDGGANWLRTEKVLPQWSYHAKLRAVDDQAGHLWFAPGRQESVAAIGCLLRSTDGGKSWTELDNTTEVLNVALGKSAPDADYATIFIQGRMDGDFGYFKSIDEGESWTKIGTHPLGIYDAAKVMHADSWRHDRLYVGFGGNGFIYYDGTADVERPRQ